MKIWGFPHQFISIFMLSIFCSEIVLFTKLLRLANGLCSSSLHGPAKNYFWADCYQNNVSIRHHFGKEETINNTFPPRFHSSNRSREYEDESDQIEARTGPVMPLSFFTVLNAKYNYKTRVAKISNGQWERGNSSELIAHEIFEK